MEIAGIVAGTMRITREPHEAGVHGFALDAPWRGRGIGTGVLRRACHQLRAQGAPRITLDVAVDNDAALRLDTGLGFAPVTTEDYYALSLSVLSRSHPCMSYRCRMRESLLLGRRDEAR